MRTKKIRGHRRRHKQIDRWVLDNSSIQLADYLSNGRNRHYAKIGVHPWNGVSIMKSKTPEPTRRTKEKICNGLLEIYRNWKNQLDKIDEPFYLKVWLFEPRFSQSQVVCAVGDSIDFYKKNFFKPDNRKEFPYKKYGPRFELGKLNWEHYLDEDHYDNCEVGEPGQYASLQDYEETKNWFQKLIKKPHRTHKFKEAIGDRIESYSFTRGDVWLGE